MDPDEKVDRALAPDADVTTAKRALTPFADAADDLEPRPGQERADAANVAIEEAERRHRHVRADAELLEANGYVALRTAILGPVQALLDVNVDTIEVAIRHAERAAARLALTAVHGDPAARAQARTNAETEVELLKAARKFRRDLKTLEERRAARDRITAE